MCRRLVDPPPKPAHGHGLLHRMVHLKASLAPVKRRRSSEEGRSIGLDGSRSSPDAIWGRVGERGVCSVRGPDRAPGPRAPPCAITDSPATAGRDGHVASSPGHLRRWAQRRGAALERAARDRAGRPRGGRGCPARHAASSGSIGGTIVHITPPGRFAKPSRVTLELGQLVQVAPGRSELVPWVFDLEDRRFNIQMRRHIMLALFAAEGGGIGASLGAQAGPSSPAYLGLGAAVGLLTGVGYASLMPGRETSLEPGDTFKITVGTLTYRPLTPSPPLSLYPAPDPAKGSKEHGR